MENDRRFLEETFPVKEVSIESAREKNIRHGHISTLHIWWARRPLTLLRSTNYVVRIPAPETYYQIGSKGISNYKTSLIVMHVDNTR